jgi:hypothetical protein
MNQQRVYNQNLIKLYGANPRESLFIRSPAALRQAGLKIKAHADHFAQAAPDVEWLTECGKKGWVALAKDKNIKRNLLERQALFDAGLAAFSLSELI